MAQKPTGKTYDFDKDLDDVIAKIELDFFIESHFNAIEKRLKNGKGLDLIFRASHEMKMLLDYSLDDFKSAWQRVKQTKQKVKNKKKLPTPAVLKTADSAPKPVAEPIPPAFKPANPDVPPEFHVPAGVDSIRLPDSDSPASKNVDAAVENGDAKKKSREVERALGIVQGVLTTPLNESQVEILRCGLNTLDVVSLEKIADSVENNRIANAIDFDKRLKQILDDLRGVACSPPEKSKIAGAYFKTIFFGVWFDYFHSVSQLLRGYASDAYHGKNGKGRNNVLIVFS